MMDAQARTNAILGSASLSLDDAREAARTVEQLGNTISSSNLVTSDMMASLSAHTRETLNSLEKAFAINKQLLNRTMQALQMRERLNSMTPRFNFCSSAMAPTASLQHAARNWTLSKPDKPF
jgi:hypothetical protein